jgi:hypothetical protein
VLELETVSLGRLKRYQIACYVNLYVRNRRFPELARLVVEHRAVGWEMLRSAVGRSVLETVRRGGRPRDRSVPATLSPNGDTDARGQVSVPVPLPVSRQRRSV